ncbi:hypothetical protein BEL04_12055 [Mucilaginibacter sp. PPCGB 2223]|uniref:hypothetical protein n=1 Tax=Mucilaginibacter sp. PPCGB 2223 TaxID=1886027 RepID=UPI000826495A|nr:hypothetical protein [Mucilaginibacter sp. PPCGB 2223]OCX52211.1 hypothetical protein BEL04_12055 [Mucilaginibacter sp. PPCGB 2223]
MELLLQVVISDGFVVLRYFARKGVKPQSDEIKILSSFARITVGIWALPAARAIRSYCTGISHGRP